MSVVYDGHEAEALYSFLRKEQGFPRSQIHNHPHSTEHWKLKLYGHEKYPYGWYTVEFKDGSLLRISRPVNANDINRSAPVHMNFPRV